MHPLKLVTSVSGWFRYTITSIGLIFLINTTPAVAATRTWTGGHASSANWNLRDNWGGIAVPADGDYLVFPAGAARLANTNNIAGLHVSAIEFSGAGGGYNLRGLGLSMSNGVTALGVANNTINLDSLTLDKSQLFSIALSHGLTVNSDIALNGFSLSIAAIGDITMTGAISGNGNVSKSGVGQLSWSGPNNNTFAGSLTISSGTLAMNRKELISLTPIIYASRIAVPGNLILGNGSGTVLATMHFEHQIANSATVTINENATLNLNDHHDTVGGVVMMGGLLTTGTGTLTLGGNISSLPSPNSSVLSGNLFLGTNSTFSIADGNAGIDLDIPANIDAGIAGITKIGMGTLRLGGTNTYLGTTFVEAGQLNVGNDSALGTLNGTTIVKTNAQLFLELPVDLLKEHLTLAGAGPGGTNAALRVSGTATIEATVQLSAPSTINVPSGNSLTIDGVISGPGSLTKIGGGTLRLEGDSANTFSGDLMAEDGLLYLSKLAGSAVQGDLVVGTTESTAIARHTRGANLGGSVTVNAGSLYDLDGYNESIDALTLNGGGDVQTGTGQLTIQGDVVVNAGIALTGRTSTIDGRLHVDVGERHFIVAETGGVFGDGADLVINARIAGTANIVKSGAGDLSLTASNSFTGTVTIEDGELLISNDHALGSTAANTVLTSDSIITLSDGLTVDENLFLNTAGKPNVGALRNQGTNTWTGSLFLGQTTVVNVLSNGELNLTGAINGLSGLTKIGPGLLVYSGTASNTYIGTTRVNEGILRLGRIGGDRSIAGELIIGDGLGGDGVDRVELAGPDEQINNNSRVIVNGSGLLRHDLAGPLEVIGSLAGNGRVHVGLFGKSLMTGGNNDSTAFDGIISGDGWVNKLGTGTWTLGGSNLHTGGTIVGNGTLVVNGHQPNSPVGVLVAGTLRGTGRAGHVNVFGSLSPGNNLGSLTSENLTFQPGSHYRVELNGTDWDDEFDRMDAYGNVDLTGGILDASLGFAPPAGYKFVIIRKQGGLGVTGTFVGLPEGAVVAVDGIPFHISYVGGDGNDVVLTVADLPLRVASTRIEAGNGNGRIDPDECNNLFVTIENAGLFAINGVTARLDALDPRIAVTQAESIYDDIPPLASATNRSAFQIRIASGYPCGSAVDLQLVIQSDSYSPFALPIRLLAGAPGSLQTVESTDVPRLIPDLGAAQSTIDWPDNFSIGQMRVRIHATHPAAGQLRFRLRAPWGGEVLLSANRGGAGDNYGIDCARPTLFDAAAATNIAAATAPFAGPFAPEGNFDPFINRLSGGVWTLVMEDTVAGNLGALQCWSLELARAVCGDGGGGCESCTTKVEGTFLEASLTMPERLRGTGEASGCGNLKPCPVGPNETVGPYRYNTHSFTNDGPDTCVTVLMFVPCPAWTNGLYSSAYLNDFDPGNLCAGYLGDIGQRIHSYYGEGSAYSFRVPAGQRFTVVVNEGNSYTDSAQGCGTYRLELFGLPCPQEQPTLHIANDAGPDKVRLHWSTAYPGFQLQGTPNLGGVALFAFTNVATTPVVVGGSYSVTNNATNKHGFFRLRKP